MMCSIAGDDGNVICKKPVEHGVGNGNLTMVEYHNAQVFDGDDGFLIALGWTVHKLIVAY